MDARAGEAPEPRSKTLPRLFWAGTVAVGLALVWLARVRPSWPWFSLWVLALLGLLAVLSAPRVRKGLNLSWFAVTLLVLTGTGLFDLYLFHVETHRQRSERLEVRGVYFDPDVDPIRVGVGREGLDVRLEGSLYDFDRWSLELRALDAARFVVDRPYQVDMLRVRSQGGWWPGGPSTVPALGEMLGGRRRVARVRDARDEDVEIELLPEGRRGTLRWGAATAPLSVADPLLDRRLSGRLGAGVPLAELDWDSIPDRTLASDLVLTRTRRGRSLGRLRLTLPRYRLVSRTRAEPAMDSTGAVLSPGDTLWVTSRGKTWAFALGRVPGVSRVAAPVAIHFVLRPRPTGWALPSPEACGRSSDRCAVISTRPLPPPQPHFDLSGFGLDTARYSILARLETDGNGVRVVGARSSARVQYGAVHPLPALTGGRDDGSTGVLMSVSREAQGRQSAVLLTVLTLYLMFLGALLILSGDARLWARRRADSPHMAAAWGFLNVFVIFLGIRLALGLRVAYTPPFYDRAAATAVGLWVAFTVMLVALGRWSSWAPRFWRMVARVERPISRLFLPGVNGSGTRAPAAPTPGPGPRDPAGSAADARAPSGPERRSGLFRTVAGLLLYLPCVGFVIWQRPEAAASLLVAAVGLGAWLAMGVSGLGASAEMSRAPLGVITADQGVGSPSVSFAVAAGAAVVLVLAMHAPELALVPVLVLLALFGVNLAVGWTAWADKPARRGWVVYASLAAMAAFGLVVFSPWPLPSLGALALVGVGAGIWVARRPAAGSPPRIEALYGDFTDLRDALFSGVGWIGVLVVLGLLVFLNSQAIPPFVRFALVFMLFLLAIRAGLACHRVLRQGPDEQGRQRGRIEALGLLVIPLGVLLVFMLFDFGLGLVFFAPMFVTVLLAARVDRLPAALMLASAAVVVGVGLVALSVLRPSLADLRASADVPTFSREYGQVGNELIDVLRSAGLSGPITRATVRSMAASDPALLEEALAFAGPSEALLAAAPSREQVWGGLAYAASGWTGTGFAGTALLGRGVPTAVSYAENTYSVYVLSEHGALGGIAVLLTYLALLVVVMIWIVRVRGTVQDTSAGRAVLAMTVGGVLWLTVPAAYVAASNLGLVPLTGQNMPFLGLNSWADVVLVSGLATGIVLALAALGPSEVEEGGS